MTIQSVPCRPQRVAQGCPGLHGNQPNDTEKAANQVILEVLQFSHPINRHQIDLGFFQNREHPRGHPELQRTADGDFPKFRRPRS